MCLPAGIPADGGAKTAALTAVSQKGVTSQLGQLDPVSW